MKQQMRNEIASGQLAEMYREASLVSLAHGDFEEAQMLHQAYTKITLESRAEPSCDMETENA